MNLILFCILLAKITEVVLIKKLIDELGVWGVFTAIVIGVFAYVNMMNLVGIYS